MTRWLQHERCLLTSYTTTVSLPLRHMSQISANTLPLPKRLDSEDSREDLLEAFRELQERKGWKHFLHRLEDLAEQADRQLRTETDLHLLPHLQGNSKAFHAVLDLP